jgi:mRNA interferase RelE/StbE
MYRVEMRNSVRKQLEKAPAHVRGRLADAIIEMTLDPRRNRSGFDCRKLGGSDRLWRVRVGEWRMTYEIDDVVHVVEVTKVAPRPTAYR